MTTRPQRDGVCVGVALSGGGHRAALFAAGALLEHRGASLLLVGDGHAEVYEPALGALLASRGEGRAHRERVARRSADVLVQLCDAAQSAVG
jgi:hypothetical protein